jgi:hypothetical protein
MADVAVGHRNQFDRVSGPSPLSGRATRFEFGVIRVRAEDDNPQFLGRFHRCRWLLAVRAERKSVKRPYPAGRAKGE